MTYFLPIQGTHGWDGSPTLRWWMPGSPFALFLRDAAALEIAGAGEDPFIWSTDVDGLPYLRRRKLVRWKAAGLNLRRYCKPGPAGTDEGAHYLPYQTRNFIAHSHGLQVALCAAAAGLRIRTLVSVSSPVRDDMSAIAAVARPNIGTWWHIASDRSDATQWLGELFDGAFGIVREHPLADFNVCVKQVGHSRLLEDPAVFHEWKDRGILTMLTRVDPAPAVA